jgi:selenocysteine-specific elongation factor
MSEKEHVIIGTAGHVDHGKSALVKALTGKDPDTLPEEKLRGMTIELGFVFMEIPGYEKQIVFIDVPGHERFVKTMAAGASHIDAALFVIAADEGICVQTREHFDILKLLGLETGMIALTKSDLVTAPQLVELTCRVSDFVKDSFLENSPVVPVSAVTGAGLADVRAELQAIGRRVKERRNSGFFRMPIDRVFTMHGFGTVIAGTILSGEVKTGDKLEILPEGISVKVRGIQVHNEKKDKSGMGKRTALNLQDFKKDLLRRGQCAVFPGTFSPSIRLDVKLDILKSAETEVKQRERVRLHIGTDEVIARVALLEDNKIIPEGSGLAQLILESPTVALRGDRFVIRTLSPLMTVGGGLILDGSPEKHKRFDAQVIEGLRKLEQGTEQAAEQVFLNSGFQPKGPREVAMILGENEQTTEGAIQSLFKSGILTKASDEKAGSWLHARKFEELSRNMVSLLKSHLKANPHYLFMPYSDLRSQFLKTGEAQAFKAVLDNLCRGHILYQKGSSVGLVGYELKLKPREEELAVRIERIFKSSGFDAPLEEDVATELELDGNLFKNILAGLVQQGKLVRLSNKVIYHREVVEKATEMVLGRIRENGGITIAVLRDELALSRKYAQAILEYLDRVGVTRRVEDRHVMK